MTSPLMSFPGAATAPDGSPDAGVAWHYGDPFAEQRAATTSAVVTDRSNRGLLAVPGDDRLSWLHSLTSQHLTELGDGCGTQALLLDLNGRVEQHLVLADLDGTTWIDTEATGTPALLAYLQKMVFWADVAPRDAHDELAVLSVQGPTADRLLELPGPIYGVAALDGGGFVRRMPAPAGSHAADVVVPRAQLARWWARLIDAGARAAGSWAFEALRVEALRVRAGVDTDERTIPHEVGLIGAAVHLNKGCYRGQETIARVHNLGKPPRRLVLLHLDGSADALPLTGDEVTAGGRVVGRVGTVAEHHELGPIALALVKRTVPADTELVAGPCAAAIDAGSIAGEDAEQAGRVAVAKLRGY